MLEQEQEWMPNWKQKQTRVLTKAVVEAQARTMAETQARTMAETRALAMAETQARTMAETRAQALAEAEAENFCNRDLKAHIYVDTKNIASITHLKNYLR